MLARGGCVIGYDRLMRTGSEEDYENLSKDPQHWLNKALSLHAAAGAVWHCTEVEKPAEVAASLGHDTSFDCGVWQVYRSLCGMSLELILKSILMLRNEPVTATGRKVPNGL